MSQRKAEFQTRGRRPEAAILLKIESLDLALTVLSRPGKAPHIRNHFSVIRGENSKTA